jgi:hypothetical protein
MARMGLGMGVTVTVMGGKLEWTWLCVGAIIESQFSSFLSRFDLICLRRYAPS